MTFSLELRPIAQRDVESAHRWYEARQRGLGLEFEACVEQAFARILSDPESYDSSYRDLRRLPVIRFPYQVYFVVHGMGRGSSSSASCMDDAARHRFVADHDGSEEKPDPILSLHHG